MNLISTLLQRSRQRRMYTSLLQLDDHLLKDIGLNRADLRAQIIASQSASLVGNNARS